MVRFADNAVNYMGLPRLNRTKFALSLREIAHLSGESLSAIKRLSIKDPAAARAMANKLSQSIGVQPEPENEYDPAISALVHVHFDLASLRYSLCDTRPDIYERLTAILDITDLGSKSQRLNARAVLLRC
jgi:hypothetical protein